MRQLSIQERTPSRPPRKRVIAIVCCGLAVIWAAFGAGCLGSWLVLRGSAPHQSNTAPDGNTVVSSDEADIAGVAQRVSKSVVSIITAKSRGGLGAVQGAGTGIIISQDGYILTNKHVIDGASQFEVVTSDGMRFKDVSVVGADPLNDIAFLKLKQARDLPAATLGNSGTVRVGQKVIAIGNSLGQYQNTVTSGIISGKGRPIEAAGSSGQSVESLTDLLQTDAAINPGNSGGPLLNMSGQVIGINTAIVSDAQNMGFAIPINAAKGLVRSVLANGSLQKAYIGVRYIAITPEVKAEYNLPVNNGAYVGPASDGPVVEPGGPADRAGIKSGDIITKIDNKTVGEQGGLGSIVAEYLPGETVTLTLLRDGKQRDIQLTLGSYKS